MLSQVITKQRVSCLAMNLMTSDSVRNISIENAIASDHETASELSGNESDDQDAMQVIETGKDSDVSDPGKKYMYGKNRYKWAATEPTRNVRTPAHNILKLPGNRNALPIIEALKTWQQIFSQDILDSKFSHKIY
ncbi:hypothetical protein QE152_g4181 [Popillia japonica]|uniref:Uncharacterized protein n=1 Tax=Popillia japonica TaxID=7064 RepID=A0AAW1N1G6_POPJA